MKSSHVAAILVLAGLLGACGASSAPAPPSPPPSAVATLASLACSAGTLVPPFDPLTNVYAVEVGPDDAHVTLTAAATDASAAITVDGEGVVPGVVAKGVDLGPVPVTVRFEVTAEDGVTQRAYSVTFPVLPFPPISGFGQPGTSLRTIALPAPVDNVIWVTDEADLLVEGLDIVGTKLFFVRCRNVWVRDCRIDYTGIPGAAGDCLAFTSCENVVVSNCVLSGATDENLDLWNTVGATVQYNILGPGATEGHDKEVDHSAGLICGAGTGNVSVHHNLFVGNRQRNPICYGDGSPDFSLLFDVRNNLVYDCYGGAQLGYGGDANVVANLFLSPRRDLQIRVFNEIYGTTSSVFLEGNEIWPAMALVETDASTILLGGPLGAPAVPALDAWSAGRYVLRHAGRRARTASESALIETIGGLLDTIGR